MSCICAEVFEIYTYMSKTRDKLESNSVRQFASLPSHPILSDELHLYPVTRFRPTILSLPAHAILSDNLHLHC